ncbi:MAG TPA: hypothetical protein VKQ32_12515 [Polyangia bacterium]|nr:hypothetical protein [Polyangia bacterium]
MAISRKGRRRIVVGGSVFYWDYRVAGNKPGDGPIWDWPTERRPSVVRVVSEDKRWRLTVQMRGGYKVQIDPGRKESRLADSIPRVGTVTPAFVRQLIEKYFQPPA